MIRISQVTSDELASYNTIPMTLVVKSIFSVEVLDHGLGGFQLIEEPVEVPWIKDYEDGQIREGVARWQHEFDVSHWGFFLAHVNGQLAGGATIASRTDGLWMLDSRRDLGVLRDIRVKDEFKRQGVGAQLFKAAAEWCRSQGLVQIKIETQNVNVPACRFYAAMGCELRGIVHHAYAAGSPQLAREVQFLWWLDL